MSAILNNPGRYKVAPKVWNVKEVEKNGTIQLYMVFQIIEAWNEATSSWDDYTAYDLEKNGYFYLTKKDGTINENTVKSLKEAIGWQGTLADLQNGDWSGVLCQITVDYEEYQGQRSLKIKWLNHVDFDGVQIKPTDPATLKALDAKWGSKFRAIGGAPKPPAPPQRTAPRPAASAPATPKPQTRPSAPPAAKPPVGPPPVEDLSPPPSVAQECFEPTKEGAWAAVCAAFGGNVDAATGAWPETLKAVHPGKPINTYTPDDWAKVVAKADVAIPF